MLSFLNPLPALPDYTGPHKVGSAEYEIPINILGLEPLSIDVSLSTIRFRIFYPATARGTRGVPWVPEPQTMYLEGYLKLARLNSWLASLLLSVPIFLRSTSIPAYGNAKLAYVDHPLPVLIFSHGLVGSMSTHTAILGELASHGVFCVALEHRDGSGALSLVRTDLEHTIGDAPTEMSSVDYRQVSLKIRPGVLEERDKQLQIRTFELMALYHILELLNQGEALKNLASSTIGDFGLPQGSLRLGPGAVAWAGHSFGGTTIIQLLKSIYYGSDDSSEINSTKNTLLLQRPMPSLVAQITPLSPVALLDPWFLPLKSPSTQWLLRTPLPCHDVSPDMHRPTSKTVVVMSTEYAFHWPQCHSHMPAVISPDPVNVRVQTQEEYDIEFKRFTSPRNFMNESKKAKARLALSDQTAVKKVAVKDEVEAEKASAISTFVLHDTTHVTHSDFGLLFQWVTWWVTGQKKPELAVQNIARCILGAAGMPVAEGPSDAARAQLEQLS